MTLQPLPSEFPYIWGKFSFLFYLCTHQIMMRRTALVLSFSVRKISASLGFSSDDDFSLPLDSGSSPALLGWPSEAAALLCRVQKGSKKGIVKAKLLLFASFEMVRWAKISISTARGSTSGSTRSFLRKNLLNYCIQLVRKHEGIVRHVTGMIRITWG